MFISRLTIRAWLRTRPLLRKSGARGRKWRMQCSRELGVRDFCGQGIVSGQDQKVSVSVDEEAGEEVTTVGYSHIELPRFDETSHQGVILRWEKGEGEPVSANEDLCLVDTDIAEFYVHAETDGILARIEAGAGVKVETGDVLGIVVHENADIASSLAAYDASFDRAKDSDGEGEAGGTAPPPPSSPQPNVSESPSASAQEQRAEPGSAAPRLLDLETTQLQDWLKSLDFDEQVLSLLKNYKGKDIAKLSKQDAEKYFGLAGLRLFGNIKERLALEQEDADPDASKDDL